MSVSLVRAESIDSLLCAQTASNMPYFHSIIFQSVRYTREIKLCITSTLFCFSFFQLALGVDMFSH